MVARIKRTARETGLKVRVIRRDSVPRCGPLGGMVTALKSSRSEAVLFMACDMPFVTVQLLQRLLSEFNNGAVFVQRQRQVGFPFVLARSLLPRVTGQIERGELSLQRLAAVLKAKVIRLPKAFAKELCNVNTLQEFAAAKRHLPKNPESATRTCAGEFKNRMERGIHAG